MAQVPAPHTHRGLALDPVRASRRYPDPVSEQVLNPVPVLRSHLDQVSERAM